MRKPPTNQEVAICPANAFIDPTQYAVTGPVSNDDFPRYSAEIATKYPDVIGAYKLLINCWYHYHPAQK